MSTGQIKKRNSWICRFQNLTYPAANGNKQFTNSFRIIHHDCFHWTIQHTYFLRSLFLFVLQYILGSKQYSFYVFMEATTKNQLNRVDIWRMISLNFLCSRCISLRKRLKILLLLWMLNIFLAKLGNKFSKNMLIKETDLYHTPFLSM